MNEPLSFEEWCHEVDIESQYKALHDEYGYATALGTEGATPPPPPPVGGEGGRGGGGVNVICLFII